MNVLVNSIHYIQKAHVLKFKTENPNYIYIYIYIYIYTHTLSLCLFWHVCQNMRKLRSCSFSTCLIVYVLFTFTFLTSNIEAFDSLLQLPLSGSTRTRPRSKRVIFVGDFGAQGDGVNDDTEVDYCWPNFCYLMIMSFIFFFLLSFFEMHDFVFSVSDLNSTHFLKPWLLWA